MTSCGCLTYRRLQRGGIVLCDDKRRRFSHIFDVHRQRANVRRVQEVTCGERERIRRGSSLIVLTQSMG